MNERHRQLVDRARAVEESRHTAADEAAEPDLSDLSGAATALAAMAQQSESIRRMIQGNAFRGQVEEDTRTLDEYIKQVDTWRDRLTKAAIRAAPGLYIADGHGVIAFQVRNLGSRFLPDVEVELRFDFEPAVGLHAKPSMDDLPRCPRDYGEPSPASVPSSALLSGRLRPLRLPSLDVVGRRTWVEKGSIVVTFAIGDLRQHATDTSDSVYILLRARPEGGVLKGSWKATVRDIDGLLTGTLDVRGDRQSDRPDDDRKKECLIGERHLWSASMTTRALRSMAVLTMRR